MKLNPNFILIITVALMILACKAPTNNNLAEEWEVDQASDKSKPSDSTTIVAKEANIDEPSVNNEHVVGKNLSGTYVSEITSNQVWYFTTKHKKLILTLKQHGNQITATDSTNNTKITGILEGDVINFEIWPGNPTSFNRGFGQWTTIGDSDKLEGT